MISPLFSISLPFFGPQLALDPPSIPFFGYLFEAASSCRHLSGIFQEIIIFLVLGWLAAGSPYAFSPLSQVSIV